jgi:hypothetical protein
LYGNANLPEEPDTDTINTLLVQMREEFYAHHS